MWLDARSQYYRVPSTAPYRYIISSLPYHLALALAERSLPSITSVYDRNNEAYVVISEPHHTELPNLAWLSTVANVIPFSISFQMWYIVTVPPKMVA